MAYEEQAMADGNDKASAREWTGVTGGSAFGQRAMKILCSLVSVRVGYAILVFVIPFYMLFARKGYNAIYSYFRTRHNYPPMKAFGMTYLNHYRFGQMILDRFAVYAGQRNFRVDNPDNDLFLQMVNSDKGCIIATAHVGNPELCGYLLSQQTKRINSLIFGGEAKEVQKNRSAVLGNNNVRLVPVDADMSHLFVINDALTNGEMVSMPCDRPFGSAKTASCTFLGAETNFPIGAFVMASRFDLPVIALFVLKVSAKLYRIHVIGVPAPTRQQIADNATTGLSTRSAAYAMTRSYAAILEEIVKKYPEQWFNFYNFWDK
ncbi:MAG: lipid A biosynthesis (KDO)2-(lauroyl)-lipid IVA acyltransferase [Tannerella sp.]|jgi:predicted LPLAT superfamily acyltransferase|nr:lipid A biosynthesis (KDO)2-(lauroyl)-lipid IVA acyltransferase [Tannerella sp.]